MMEAEEMQINKQTFFMMLAQVSDGNNRTTANLAKEILKADPGKIKLT